MEISCFHNNLDCKRALGMESGAISDGQIIASSEYSIASNGRLHLQPTGENAGCWAAGTIDLYQWLQVDLGSLNTIVTVVATQGRSDSNQWVTKYKLQYSNDGLNFQYYRTDTVRSTRNDSQLIMVISIVNKRIRKYRVGFEFNNSHS